MIAVNKIPNKTRRKFQHGYVDLIIEGNSGAKSFYVFDNTNKQINQFYSLDDIEVSIDNKTVIVKNKDLNTLDKYNFDGKRIKGNCGDLENEKI